MSYIGLTIQLTGLVDIHPLDAKDMVEKILREKFLPDSESDLVVELDEFSGTWEGI